LSRYHVRHQQVELKSRGNKIIGLFLNECITVLIVTIILLQNIISSIIWVCDGYYCGLHETFWLFTLLSRNFHFRL